MNRNPFGLALAVLGTFLIVAALVYVMREYTQPAPLGQARIDQRKKFLAEIQAANAEALQNYGWQDQAKGLVRLKIDQAMKLTVQDYQHPAVARSNLSARADKAFAPPPKAPEKPNPFE
jgi:hypothetical protein